MIFAASTLADDLLERAVSTPRIFCGLSHIFRQREIWLDNRAVGGRLIGDVQGGAQLRH